MNAETKIDHIDMLLIFHNESHLQSCSQRSAPQCPCIVPVCAYQPDDDFHSAPIVSWLQLAPKEKLNLVSGFLREAAALPHRDNRAL